MKWGGLVVAFLVATYSRYLFSLVPTLECIYIGNVGPPNLVNGIWAWGLGNATNYLGSIS